MSAGFKIQTTYYPESDGKPMGETDWHRKAIMRLIELLQRRYADQRVYVTGDLLLYYEEGNPKKFVVPDVFVVKDSSPKDRRIYKMWLENKPPHAIIEVTSRKTRKKDATEKPKLYTQLGVKEYFVFDPEGDYLDPPLQGYRLGRSGYRRITKDADGRLPCQELGIGLILEDADLQLYDADSGARLLTGIEEAARMKHEAARMEQETARMKQEAASREQEAARLQEENRQLRAELSRRKPNSKS